MLSQVTIESAGSQDSLLVNNYLDYDWIYPLTSATTATKTTIFYVLLVSILLLKYRKQKRTVSNSTNKVFQDGSAPSQEKGKLKSIPKPPMMPIIGHMYMMRNYADNPWEGFNAIRQQYGDIVQLQMGIHPMILLSKIDYMQEVLLSKGHLFADRPNFMRYDIIFGGNKENSLALCKWSDVHRVRRKFCKRTVVPSKFSERNQLLESTISDHSIGLIAKLKARCETQSNQACCLNKNDILFLTGDIFMKYLCEEKFSHDNKSYQRFNWCCDYIFHDINNSQPVDFLPFIAKLGVQRSYLRELKEYTDSCRNFIDENIFEPRYQMHKRNYHGEAQKSVELYRDCLDSIILEQLSETTIMTADDYKVGFADLLAGHSAVANILMRLLGHLALDREAQDMLCEEAKKTRLSSLDHKPATPVAEAALLEALRFASSPIVPHIAREDTSIGDYFVPKGSNILFNYYNINMSEDYWKEPCKFNIRRFLVEQTVESTGERCYKLNRPKFFTPFSVGLRQCLGFRMVESISHVASLHICENFILTVDDVGLAQKLLKPKGSVALSPFEKCFELKLTPRLAHMTKD